MFRQFKLQTTQSMHMSIYCFQKEDVLTDKSITSLYCPCSFVIVVAVVFTELCHALKFKILILYQLSLRAYIAVGFLIYDTSKVLS